MTDDLASRILNGQIQPQDLLHLCAADLACYCVASYPSFQLARHIEILLTELEAVERGDVKRLIVSMPPRHGKSLTSSVHFPAWYLGKHPDHSIISCSYGQDLSDDFGRKVRNLVSDSLHRATFAACLLSEDSTSMRRFNTTAGGSYYAVGRGGAITGRGANLLLIDDPLKDLDEAQSEIIRRGLHEWYASVAYTRLQPGGAIVLVTTRWHEADLAGWLMREHADERWKVVSLPAIAEADDDWRKEGEALWTERYPVPVLAEIRAAIGTAAWTSLYQQRPSAAEGQIFKRDWFERYSTPPESFTRIIQSWDTAFKSGRENDFSVCTTWGEAKTGYYLLHLWRARVEFPELKRKVEELAGLWTPSAVLVEDKASGQSLLQELKAETLLPIRPIRVDSDKVARAQAVTPLLEAGRVFIPPQASWCDDFLDEVASFPNGIHDDQVDSLTQGLAYLRGKGGLYGLTEYVKNLARGIWDLGQPASTAQLDAMEQRLRSEEQPRVEPKPLPAAPSPAADACPKCGSRSIQLFARGRFSCPACAHTWDLSQVTRPATRMRPYGDERCLECGLPAVVELPRGLRRCRNEHVWHIGPTAVMPSRRDLF
jgi:predicted phage terminase large subunit-like protein